MTFIRRLGLFLVLSLSSMAHAGLMTYTNLASFLADLPGTANVLNFDSEAAGTLIGSGGTLQGITFNYDFGGVQMMIADGDDTTSMPNFLGTDDGGLFQDGDEFDLGFGLVNAIGMVFISSDLLFDGDITLTAGGATASLIAADGVDVGGDNTAYFLGIIDDSATFTTASIGNVGGGFFLYNVDDITTAAASTVPVPSTLLLFALGLSGVLVRRRRRLTDLA